MDRQFTKLGPNMSAISQLNSDIHNPSYNFQASVHESNLPPTAAFLFKVMKLMGHQTLVLYINDCSTSYCLVSLLSVHCSNVTVSSFLSLIGFPYKYEVLKYFFSNLVVINFSS